jgi:putative hydrolase of the HAD superfamily
MDAQRITHVFLDLDDTLYAPQRMVWDAIAGRINRYMVERVGIRESEVDGVRRRYFDAYGTTCNGLRREHSVDPQDFYRFVHDIPVDRMLAPDPDLRRMLSRLGRKKFIFSNADQAYIRRVLSALGVADCFDEIIDIFSTGFACKPLAESYRIAMEKTGASNPKQCVLVDDLPRNLAAAQKLGWEALLVNKPPPEGLPLRKIESIYRLPEYLE